MKKKWLILIAVGLFLLLLGLVLKAKVFGQKAPGALQVSSTPKAIVYLDNAQAGSTPFFNDKIQPGEHALRLVPEGSDKGMPWEVKVNLTSGILVIVNRDLGETEITSSGEILTLEKIDSKDKSELSVISIPDGAVVKVEGEPKGFAPISLQDLTPGNYQLVISSPGYEEKTISAKTIAGYRLIVSVQLARKDETGLVATDSAKEATGAAKPNVSSKTSPTPTVKPKTTATPEPEKPYVRVKETPTGFLRVRMAPSTTATEAARISPGETYPYLDEQKSGWYKIEYEPDKEGWVSGTYVELVQ